MALTFAFFTDAALTTPTTGFATDQNADGTTPPVDRQRYLGSTTASRRLRAASDPGTDPILVTVVNATAVWAATTAYALNAEVRTPTANGHKYRATTAGTSAGSAPTWPTGAGATVADGTVVWTEIGALSEAAEVKLATTQAGLTGASPGASLSLGASILSGSGSAVTFWARVHDANNVVMTDSELRLETVSVVEDVP